MKRFNGAFQNICSFKIIVSDLLQALCESPQFGRQQVNEQERQCTYNVTLKSVHETTVVESYNYYKRDCVCACVCVCECSGAWACECLCARVSLLIQNATHMRQIVTSFMVPLAQLCFSTLSHIRHSFRK